MTFLYEIWDNTVVSMMKLVKYMIPKHTAIVNFV